MLPYLARSRKEDRRAGPPRGPHRSGEGQNAAELDGLSREAKLGQLLTEAQNPNSDLFALTTGLLHRVLDAGKNEQGLSR